MEGAPLYQALLTFTNTNPLRLHMPGHKGKGLPGWEHLAELDLTELPPTGDLYRAGGPIWQAEQLWARAFGMPCCQMLTGGSTQGLFAALTLACPPGSSILVDRRCHRSVYNIMALLDLNPVYLWDKTCQGVEDALEEHPEIRVLCVTSPDYYGRLFDLQGMAKLCHSRGLVLVVDGAHGAHLPFLGRDHFSQADLAVCSVHKTLPALGQSALLFSGGRFSPGDLRRAACLYGTSSPSYPILASMDLARAWMESEEGRTNLRRLCARTTELRARFPVLEGNVDPTRLTLLVPDGYALERGLQQQNIWPEMADRNHLVLIFSPLDSEEDLDRLETALIGLHPREFQGTLPELPIPERGMSLHQALFAPKQTKLLSRCEGQISGQQLGLYPPGIPVVAPGEIISKKILAYLAEIGYNKNQEETIQIISR